MLKLSLWRKIAALCLVLVISACGGAGGSAPPPVGGIKVTPGNGQAFVTWNADPGVTYWLVYAPTALPLDTQNLPVGHLWATPVTSPYVVPALLNGTTYTFAINGRTDGGKGGPLSASVSTVPRAAGANWTAGSGTAATNDLHGLAYGTPDNVNYYYVSVGDNGAIYQLLDSVNQALNGYAWTPITTAPVVNYKAAINAFSRYIAVGSGAVNNISYSSDLTGTTWTAATTAVPAALNALASNGTTVVTVGNNGSAYSSTDGQNWTQITTLSSSLTSAGIPSTNLFGVVYSATSGWVVVGQGGAVITSPDLVTWTVQTKNAGGLGYDLTSVAVTSSNIFVAVGKAGTMVKSADAVTWTPLPVLTALDLYSVTTDSVQFLAVGQNGATYTSTSKGTGTTLDGLIWTIPVAIASNLPTSTLYSLIGTATKYLGVGPSGANFSSVN